MNRTEYLKQIEINGGAVSVFDIHRLEESGIAEIRRLPFSIKILVENLLRKLDHRVVREEDVLNIAGWRKSCETPVEIPYHPARVLMQDFTGVPAVVDLAAMRDAITGLGKAPRHINPLIPVELIVDHSVQVDYYGTSEAIRKNVEKEYERNTERYALLKWAQKSFDKFKVVPPNSGICHQVNLEYLGRVMITEDVGDRILAYPDTLVGLDSHTTMINGIGVMGWGVGGIEAEAVMLGQPYYMTIPQVVGVRVTGKLERGATAADLVLRITEMLRAHGVVEKFVEFFGPGIRNLSVPDRATIANMSPEYGATMGFFPVDEKTIEYLKTTDRKSQAEIVEPAARALGLFYMDGEQPDYSTVLELDLSTVGLSVAGPSRPQDRISIKDLKKRCIDIFKRPPATNARATDFPGRPESLGFDSGDRKNLTVSLYGKEEKIGDGSIVVAAVTSCTNTSNPYVLLGAGLLAKKAVEKGLKVPAHVKTSFAPGSKIVARYMTDAGLMPYLEALGFHLTAFGCTTCIGNSGPLHPQIEKTIVGNDLNAASVLSGNRNFEARIHQRIQSNFLASPMLVIAFALAGRMDIDLATEPVGIDPNGESVYLTDIWPESTEIEVLIRNHVRKEFYASEYSRIFEGDDFWKSLPDRESATYPWDKHSTYIKKPPYFDGFELAEQKPTDITDARALLLLGDSVTTDHISPAGAIPHEYPAGRYLAGEGVSFEDFNSYGSRRGNHEVMMRGTFGNIRIKNKLVAPTEGGFTLKFPSEEIMSIYEAAMRYQAEGIPLVVLAGKEYGSGSSRDWAAKGTRLLGVRAVIAESYERIHRSNLVGMGVLPLMFKPGDGIEKLGLRGSERFFIRGIDAIRPRATLRVTAVGQTGDEIRFDVTARLDTDIDVAYYIHGGIMPYVLRKMMIPQNRL